MQTSDAVRRENANVRLRRMGGAERYPSIAAHVAMGIAPLHPSYALSCERGVIFCIAITSLHVVPAKRSASSDVQLHIGRPIRRGGCCLGWMFDGFCPESICGYGSLLSDDERV